MSKGACISTFLTSSVCPFAHPVLIFDVLLVKWKVSKQVPVCCSASLLLMSQSLAYLTDLKLGIKGSSQCPTLPHLPYWVSHLVPPCPTFLIGCPTLSHLPYWVSHLVPPTLLGVPPCPTFLL